MNPNIGIYLKKLRIEKNLTLKSISHKTKIRESILLDIENGVNLNAPVFIQKSYVKSFSKTVGANQDRISKLLKTDCPKENNLQEPLSFKARIKFSQTSKIWTCLVMLFIFSLTWFISVNQVEIDETASYSIRSNQSNDLYQKKQSRPDRSIESILNSPNPFFGKNK